MGLRVSDDLSEPMCECNRSATEMKLRMTYDFDLEMVEKECGVSVYEYTTYDMRTELWCQCGKVYEEDKDYTLCWIEGAWQLEIKS